MICRQENSDSIGPLLELVIDTSITKTGVGHHYADVTKFFLRTSEEW